MDADSREANEEPTVFALPAALSWVSGAFFFIVITMPHYRCCTLFGAL